MELHIPHIDEQSNYWLVRTQSGEFYDEFFHDGFIGIGWDEFNDIKVLRTTKDDFIIEQIRKIYPEERRAGHVYNQIQRLTNEMQIGDIVLIPSHNSTHISFGKVSSDVYIEDVNIDDILDGSCPFGKRRKVDWVKTIRRDELDPYLYKLLYSHHTITNAFEYATFIDRTLHSFYIKGDKAHLVLRVRTTEQIYARDVSRLIDGTANLVDIFNSITDSDLDSNDVKVKLNVQSPGLIEIISQPYTITVIGIILVFIVGGKFNIKFTKETTDVDVQTDGLIEKILKVIQHFSKNQQALESVERNLREPIERLKLETPEELKNLPDQLTQED